MIALTGTPVIETERLVLRAPGPQDWEAFVGFILSDRARFNRPAGDYGREQAWRGFGHVVGHWVLRGFGMFVFADRTSGTALGMAGPWFPEGWPERELGWSVWQDAAEGKGYASEAVLAARDFAFGALGWDTAVSYIAPENARSVALAARLGAARDPGAPHPASDKPMHVYRHPKPSRPA